MQGAEYVAEVGGGTGSVTAAVIPLLTTCCRLDVVEANPRFADRLRLLAHSHAEHAGRVTVYNTPIGRMRTARRYDVIISGLPFANFEPEQVDDIVSRYLELLRPGGVLTYFAYRGAAVARTLFSGRAQARRHRAVSEIMADYRRRYGVGSTTVWANLPPAEVFRLRRPVRSITASGSSRVEAGR
ncbi:methyltransferase [Nocardia brevicatena]|uniref:methyltransferase n=1 Tax=Nocardia brevicatena TaxID=37327 RepID=UPI0002FBAB9C|nr:methyltransferase [Nocardia brevicatena]